MYFEKGVDKSLNILKQLESKLETRKALTKNQQSLLAQNRSTDSTEIIDRPLINVRSAQNLHQSQENYISDPFFSKINNSENLKDAKYEKQRESQPEQIWNPITSAQTTVNHQYTPQLKISRKKQRIPKSAKPWIEENKRLKKYVDCLVKMNEYLKAKLAEKNSIQYQAQNRKANTQIDLLKMEIDYLKEINDDKDKQIRKYLTSRSHTKSKQTRKRSNSKLSAIEFQNRTFSQKSLIKNASPVSKPNQNHGLINFRDYQRVKPNTKTKNTNTKLKKTAMPKSSYTSFNRTPIPRGTNY